jgi:2-succinyl-5-enolpyruvyl-6-hydroxy-3-cyclohexene-1-carboxylate synthase
VLFFGLGIAQQTKKPVVLIAVLVRHYWITIQHLRKPSIVRFRHCHLGWPTAKQNWYWWWTNYPSGKCICKSFYNANLNEMVCVENDTKIKEAIDISIAQGPVHINALWRAFVWNNFWAACEVTASAKRYAVTFTRWGSRVCYDLEPGYKKMLLVGVNDPDALSESIIETLAADESVVVLTETTSNVHHLHLSIP